MSVAVNVAQALHSGHFQTATVSADQPPVSPVVVQEEDVTDKGNVYQDCNQQGYQAIAVGIGDGFRKDRWFNGTHVVYAENNRYGTKPGQAFHQYSASVTVKAGPGEVVWAVVAHQYGDGGLANDQKKLTHLTSGQIRVFQFQIPKGSHGFISGAEACTRAA
jgi:hypothetical protein